MIPVQKMSTSEFFVTFLHFMGNKILRMKNGNSSFMGSSSKFIYNTELIVRAINSVSIAPSFAHFLRQDETDGN